MNKIKFVFNDFLIMEEYCNSNCQYCAGYYPKDLEYRRDKDNRFIMPESWKKRIKANPDLKDCLGDSPNEDDFYKLAEITLQKLEQFYNYPILKISGGEIFMYPDLSKFLSNIYSKYTSIQLLTNATLLSKRRIDEIKQFSNIYFQISLDGVETYTNSARTNNPTILSNVLKNIDYLLTSNIKLEINCVLTKYNTDSFFNMVKYFSKYKNICIVPRPVRGEPRTILEPSVEQINQLEKDLKQFPQYKYLLPPRIYFERMISMMKNNKKTTACYVPYIVMASDVYGDIGVCTRSKSLGNVRNIYLDQNKLKKYEKINYYTPCLGNRECDYCIIQYELFNLILDNIISFKELSHIPTFMIPGIENRINEIREEIKK